MTRLSLGTLGTCPPDVARPAYDPAAHGVGIVHLGCGAFHRAHQAVATDAALASKGGDWRIAAVSLRSSEIADAMAPQDGLFTLIEKGQGGPKARIVGSVAKVMAASRDIDPVLGALADPATKIVSLTVTEKAYGIDRAQGDIDESHPSIAADLQNPHAPTGVLGLVVEGLRRRFDAGTAPFTVLCCDNLPDNGDLVRTGVVAFARRLDGELAERIAAKVAFPSSMVDRITPAATVETLQLAESLTGLVDEAAIETEPFFQWVIEDRFCEGRPDWEAGGALFVADVAPYERMKLRMLNGAHSMLAYAGFLAGHAYVRDVMTDAALSALVRRHLAAAADTLPDLPGIDLKIYADELAKRFENPSIAHRTYQIAMDGSEKLPQRIVAPALDALSRGQSIRPFAFAVAAWMRYCLGRTDSGETYDRRDPREAQIARVVEQAGGDASRLVTGLLALGGVFDSRFAEDRSVRANILSLLEAMMTDGMARALSAETAAL
ncbi:mannitol dehydrogenase family protein [Fulvimarina sp. 2208YS6-2-32]|uniref:Mannitol dehydrogenase family protein n=1 Tax=Fulvimarina uroteuthidis TaxID=3098149 RepID=A0ABU5I4J4_9HYPH|nr:mannitol dehydrogenase family protein [Fulvimarina sp. 2208YS6-2-32]MDY8110311.1 mannitol dehydrogenase family protein [Fulvimarina sp. 2208YS6-2-32]